MNNLTKEELGELSDFNLNSGLASLIGENEELDFIVKDEWDVYQKGAISIARTDNPLQSYPCFPDYCNNWNDLMPLVIEHGIDLYHWQISGSWKALAFTYLPDGEFNQEFQTLNKNPQRALAECLFLVLQEKTNNENLTKIIPKKVTHNGLKYELVRVINNGDTTFSAQYKPVLPAFLQKQAH